MTVFMNNTKCFSLMFRINFDFSVNRMNIFFKTLITEVLKDVFILF